MATRLTCPECGAVLRPASPLTGRKVRCPKCSAVFRAPADEQDGLMTAVLISEPLPAAASLRRLHDADEPAVVRPAPHGHGLLLAVGLGIGGVFLLLLACGGLGALFLYYRASTDRPVGEGPGQPPRVAQAKAADAPKLAPPPVDPPAVPPLQVAPPPADAGPPPEPGTSSIPEATLRDLKSATVFIRVAGAGFSTGSGFLIHAAGDGGYVVTNHHVLNSPLGGPDFFPPGFPGAPDFPGVPRFGPPGMPPFGGGGPVTLVLWSGTPQEKQVPAQVVADDPEADLAVLRFQGLANPPHPLDPRQQPRLVETMPVYLLGFPFGQDLALDRGNPAVTVSKGSVSSVRLNQGGEVGMVQIDGDLNPGNSGGPVVDARGRLVGVAVARVHNTRIGMAIPAAQVTQLLAGKVQDFKVITVQVDKHKANLQVVARVLDPLGQLRGLSVYYVRGNFPGQRTPLAGAQKAELVRNGDRAVAQVPLPTEEQGDNLYSFQVAYVTADGRTVYTPSQVARASVQVAAPGPANGAPGAPPVALPGKQPLTDAELTEVLRELAEPEWFRWQIPLHRLAEAEPTRARRAEVLRAVEPLLKHREWATRHRAVEAYGNWAGKDGVPKLLPLVKDENGLVQWAVFDLLKEFRDERCADAVAEALVDFASRHMAAEVLRAVGPKAEKAVLRYITHKDEDVRMEACQILGDIGTRASVPALENAVKEGGLVGHFAAQALESIRRRE